MGVNPFDPPRTDLEGGAGGGEHAMPAEALRELVGTAPWARWTVWLVMISIPLNVLNAVLTMSKAKTPFEVGSQVGSLVVGLPITIVFLLLYRRYAARAGELAGGEPRAASEVIDAQRSLFKAYGIFAIIALVLVVLMTTLGIVGAMMRGRP
jgi:hypothetical protein